MLSTSNTVRIDVVLGGCNVVQRGRNMVTLYTFNFILGQELHTFTSRYSKLYQLNQLLSRNLQFQQLFNNKPPTFPSKNWMIDYSKPKHYQNRANQLLHYFKMIISKSSIFEIETFKNGINLTNNMIKKLNRWTCDLCQFLNIIQHKYCKKCNTENINVPIKVIQPFNDSFLIDISYSPWITIRDLDDKIIKMLNKRKYPITHIITAVTKESFTGPGGGTPSFALTEYKRNDIIKKGMIIEVGIAYRHKIRKNEITCKYINNCLDTLKHPIYKSLYRSIQINYHFTENNMNHFIEFEEGSFIAPKQWNYAYSNPTTCYQLDISGKLIINVKIEYRQKINNNLQSNCDEKSNHTNNPLKCPIYKSMKIHYEYTDNNLNHLIEFVHFEDEYNEKSKCKYGQKCRSFIRLQNGGNRLDDRCHVKLYNHPPRHDRQIQLAQNIHPFIINSNREQNYPLYKPTDDDKKKYKYNDKDGFLNALIEEVINNGYKCDLCLSCLSSDDCQHSEYSLLTVVDEKLSHFRHKQMDYPLRRDHMLSLVLYTGCDCNYDLCKNQRNKNYKKWIWFDYCLFNAIVELHRRELGSYKIYSGLNNVKLDKRNILNGFFPTYTSTSWIKDVSLSFVKDEGMIIEIDEKYREDLNAVMCCDVSWISRFPDECEVLIARSHHYGCDNFSVSILDEHDGIQTVSLKHSNL